MSLVALLISWTNAKRTNLSVLRIIEVCGYTRGSIHSKGVRSHRLSVLVKNLGLPLYDPNFLLQLTAPDDSGTLSIEMPKCSISSEAPINQPGELAKGMVVKFGVCSDKLSKECASRILAFCGGRQELQILDCGYLVQTFPIGGWRDRIGAKWNFLAGRTNRKFDRIIKANDGHKMLKLGKVLPTLRNYQWGVDCFLKDIKEDVSKLSEKEI